MRRKSRWVSMVVGAVATCFGLGGAPMAQEAQVGSDKASYAPFEPISATWRGLKKGTNAWIVIGRPGGTGGFASPDQSQSLSNYDGNVSSGKHTFRGYPPGKYEIRLVAPPYGNETVLARLTIVVADKSAAPDGAERSEAQLTTVKPSYVPLTPIEARWTGIRLVNGWVGIGRPGEGAFEYSRREPFISLPSNHMAKPASGSHTFDGLLPGEYELRIVHGDFGKPQVLLRHRFTIKD